ncbi:MAG: ornithine cyclodeaminase [Thermoplasmata archaeon]
MIYISEDEVNQNYSMKSSIEAMKYAFKALYSGDASVSPRQRTYMGNSVLNTMPAAIKSYGIAGLKAYIVTPKGARFVVIIYDIESSDLIAVIEANRLGQIRTGAVTAFATSLLHSDECNIFTLIGSGFQAETQLEGMVNVKNPSEIRVYSVHFNNAKNFAQKMGSKFGIDIKPFDSAKKAIEGADIITSITDSNEPIIQKDMLGDRYHINLAGANIPQRREADLDVLKFSDLVVSEHRDQSMMESFEISEFLKSGGRVAELKDVTGNPKEYYGRKKTVFKSMGIGLEDVASAHVILKNMGIIG